MSTRIMIRDKSLLKTLLNNQDKDKTLNTKKKIKNKEKQKI